MTKGEVEIHPAHVWTCEECGRDNFERGIVVEMDEDDRREMMARHGGEDQDWQTGTWMSSPTEVECKHCNAEFTTKDSRDSGDDE